MRKIFNLNFISRQIICRSFFSFFFLLFSSHKNTECNCATSFWSKPLIIHRIFSLFFQRVAMAKRHQFHHAAQSHVQNRICHYFACKRKCIFKHIFFIHIKIRGVFSVWSSAFEIAIINQDIELEFCFVSVYFFFFFFFGWKCSNVHSWYRWRAHDFWQRWLSVRLLPIDDSSVQWRIFIKSPSTNLPKIDFNIISLPLT